MADCTASIHVFLGRPLFLLSRGIHSIIDVIYFLMYFNILKAAGYVMHHQFNIQQLYALPKLYLCVLDLSENKQRLVPLTA